jgi:hypothetical protein
MRTSPVLSGLSKLEIAGSEQRHQYCTACDQAMRTYGADEIALII